DLQPVLSIVCVGSARPLMVASGNPPGVSGEPGLITAAVASGHQVPHVMRVRPVRCVVFYRLQSVAGGPEGGLSGWWRDQPPGAGGCEMRRVGPVGPHRHWPRRRVWYAVGGLASVGVAIMLTWALAAGGGQRGPRDALTSAALTPSDLGAG